jgi:hypothetical protein
MPKTETRGKNFGEFDTSLLAFNNVGTSKSRSDSTDRATTTVQEEWSQSPTESQHCSTPTSRTWITQRSQLTVRVRKMEPYHVDRLQIDPTDQVLFGNVHVDKRLR